MGSRSVLPCLRIHEALIYVFVDILVVGKAFDAHTFYSPKPSELSSPVYLTGLTCPWNTFAIWDVPKLAKVKKKNLSSSPFPLELSSLSQRTQIGLKVSSLTALIYTRLTRPASS